MRKKHGTASPSLSEKALLNLGHYHHTIEDHLVWLALEEGGAHLVAPYAQRLSELLADTAVRAMAGDSALLPHMWQNGFAADQGRRHQVRNVDQSAQEFSDRPSGSRTLSKKARKAISKAQRIRWAKFYEKQDTERARWRKSSQQRRNRDMKKQHPKSTSRAKGNAIREFWKKLKQNPVAYEAEIAKRMKARDANKAKAKAGAAA